MKRYDPELSGPCPGMMAATMEESPSGDYVLRSEVLTIVEAEPEFPDPCPKLREFISKAVETKDEDWVLHMMRETVRKTKDAIAAKLNT